MSATDHFPLPDDLPVPAKTQEAIHLAGHPLPPLIELPSTSGGYIDLFLLSLKRPVLLFVYPRTAAPGEQVADSWNAIPGARGCTPHLCGVRDSIQPLLAREADLAIFGLSTQTTEYQSEAVKRLHLPFPLLSDAKGELRKALELPTLSWQGHTFLQRATLLLRDGQITQVQHPVFPPTTAAKEALKMLDAGKAMPEATAAASSLDANMMSKTYEEDQSASVRSSFSHLKSTSRASERTVPRLRDLTGTIRSYKALEEQHALSSDRGNDWRNSLVAVDNETGEVVGILAHNVSLSSDQQQGGMAGSDDEEEAQTPPDHVPSSLSSTFFPISTSNDTLSKRQINVPFDTYHDPDVRPRSREGSVLGEDTFAPPPVPDKIEHHSALLSAKGDGDLSDYEDVLSDGEAVDGRVRTNAKHVEVHQPGLLRDTHGKEDEGAESDASGSTIGGPVVQLWRKARGGKEGERKRRMKAEARQKKQSEEVRVKEVVVENSAVTPPSVTSRMLQSIKKNSVKAQALSPPSAETVNVARVNRARREVLATSAVKSIEDRVWQSALECGSLPIDAPYTHLANAMRGEGSTKAKQQQVKANAALSSGIMQGNSVLLEFLAGSRIAASVIYGAASTLKAGVVSATQRSDAQVKISTDSATGLSQYLPVGPEHLLWYFGMGTREDTQRQNPSTVEQPNALQAATPTSYVLQLSTSAANGLVRLTSAAPGYLLDTASMGATAAWTGVSNWGWNASTWLGSTVRHYVVGGSRDLNAAADDLLDNSQPGDEDADEWEWSMPQFINGSLSKTPRPVYRRKRPTPSLYQGFQVRERSQEGDAVTSDLQRQSSRYSIIHFDHLGNGRHAYLQVK